MPLVSVKIEEPSQDMSLDTNSAARASRHGRLPVATDEHLWWSQAISGVLHAHPCLRVPVAKSTLKVETGVRIPYYGLPSKTADQGPLSRWPLFIARWQWQ